MRGIQAGVGCSELAEAGAAISEALEQARVALGSADPELAFVTCTVDYDAQAIHRELRAELPRSEIHGITTSLGVLGSQGVKIGENGALGVMLLRGDGSTFVSAGGPIGDDARGAGLRVARVLADRARGRRPGLLLFAAARGAEEDLLAGVAEVFPDVPAQGGSAADHAIAGDWQVFTKEAAIPNGISLTGIFGDVKIGRAFLAPYEHGAVDVFARVPAGSVVCRLEEGTIDGLIAGLVTLVDQALASASLKESEVKAALLTYCAGCAGSVGERLDAGLRKHIGERLPKAAVLGTCTFGEQGFIPGAGNVHSNLSLGLVLLGV